MIAEYLLIPASVCFVIGLYGNEPPAVLGSFALVIFYGIVKACTREREVNLN